MNIGLIAALVLLSAPPARSGNPTASSLTPPQLLNVGELVKADDYPIDALKRNEQGRVTVLIQVDSQGQPTGCRIDHSSGSASLDAQTCHVYITRARFAPAKDREGRPVTAEYRGTLRWQMADETILPTFARTTLTLARDGTALECTIHIEAEFGTIEKKCSEDEILPAELRRRLASLIDRDRAIVVSENQFTDSNPQLPPLDDSYLLIEKQISRLTIDETGHVIECVQLVAAGISTDPAIACESLKTLRFKPKIGPAGRPVEATKTHTIFSYARGETVG